MVPAIYSTTAAAPLLFLALRKIAHTPRARLAVGYRIVPRHEFVDAGIYAHPAYAHTAPRVEVRGLRPLGNALYLDRLLTGGTVGETLPLANLQIRAAQDPALGQTVDVVV